MPTIVFMSIIFTFISIWAQAETPKEHFLKLAEQQVERHKKMQKKEIIIEISKVFNDNNSYFHKFFEPNYTLEDLNNDYNLLSKDEIINYELRQIERLRQCDNSLFLFSRQIDYNKWKYMTVENGWDGINKFIAVPLTIGGFFIIDLIAFPGYAYDTLGSCL